MATGIVKVTKNIYVVKGSPNTGIVVDESIERAVIVDPGIGSDRDSQIVSHVESIGVRDSVIVFTHGHTDHIAIAPSLVKRGFSPVYAPRHCLPLIEDTSVRRAVVYGGLVSEEFASMPMVKLGVDFTFSDGNPIPGGLTAVSLPGHSPGHSGIASYTEKVLFVGDALLGEKVLDRFGIPLGLDLKQMILSTNKLEDFVQKGFTLVLGHGPIVNGSRALQLIEANRKAILRLRATILELLSRKPYHVEALTLAVMDLLSRTEKSPRQIALNKTAVSSVLAWLEEEGKVKPTVSNEGIMWLTVR